MCAPPLGVWICMDSVTAIGITRTHRSRTADVMGLCMPTEFEGDEGRWMFAVGGSKIWWAVVCAAYCVRIFLEIVSTMDDSSEHVPSHVSLRKEWWRVVFFLYIDIVFSYGDTVLFQVLRNMSGMKPHSQWSMSYWTIYLVETEIIITIWLWMIEWLSSRTSSWCGWCRREWWEWWNHDYYWTDR